MKSWFTQKGQTSVEHILMISVGFTLVMILKGCIGVEEKGDKIKVKYVAPSNCNHIRCD